MSAPYTVETVHKGMPRVVSVHESAPEAKRALRNTEGMAVVRNAGGRVVGTTLARSAGVLR